MTGAAVMPAIDPMPQPPFWGTGEMLSWETPALLGAIDKKSLFNEWRRGAGLTPAAPEAEELAGFETVFERLSAEILGENLLDARGYYGFFPVYTDDENLFVLDPSDFHTECAAYRFPRIETHSIADFFNPSGDLLAVQVVTIGRLLGDRCRRYLQQENRQLSSCLNALGVWLTAYLAERVTIEIRRSLFLAIGQGKRFGFGEPGLPEVAEQQPLLELLCAEERLGLRLSSGFNLAPEHAAIGLFAHNAKAHKQT
jgi:5-methyltetrahydrofolate--homocysteine methyltransferase